jgi:hypothetical protein
MEKIGGVRRPGLHSRTIAPNPHVVYEITKRDFQSSALWNAPAQ